MNIQEYYAHPETRERLKNFFEGCSWFLVAGSHYARDPNWGKAPAVRVFKIDELQSRLGQGPDIFSPLTSRNGVLGVLDIEYYNWDKKVLFLDSTDGRRFGVHDDIFKSELEQVYKSISDMLGEDIISDTTWSGYHFITNVDRGSPVYDRLLELGMRNKKDEMPRCLEDTLIRAYLSTDSSDPKRESAIGIDDGVVYNQYGRIMEFLCHKVMKECEGRVHLPITMCDTNEECLSLDISQYADPVFMRIIRTPFSSWDKHNIIPSLSGIVNEPPFLDVVRKYCQFENDDLDQVFRMAHDYESAIEYNKMFSGFVPRAGEKVMELIDEYEKSELFSFHQDFDSVDHDRDDENYKKAKFDKNLHISIREMMERPNPSLLQPRNIKWVTEQLIENGWHPKHIGGMLHGRYNASDKGWSENAWAKYDSKTRANFWARIYAGLKLAK